MNISVVERVVAHMVDLPLRPVSRVHLRRITVSLNRVGRCVRLALEAEEHAVVGHGIPGPGKLLIHADRTIQSEIVIVEVRYGVPAIRITCKASSSVASQHVYVYAGPAGVVVPHDDEERKAPHEWGARFVGIRIAIPYRHPVIAIASFRAIRVHIVAEGSYRDYWMPVWNSDTDSNET